MHILHMSWSFRALVFMVVMAWGLAPQLACFMPDPMLAPAEIDCCKKMTNDCSAPSMSHACCRAVTRTDVGIATKALRNVIPQLDSTGTVTDILPSPLLNSVRKFSKQNDH